jgi:hypothetical protein
MSLRTRNKLLLVKQESSEGTYETPSASTDAVKVENLRWSRSARLIETNEHTGVLDKSAPFVGGESFQISFDVVLRGTTAAGTAPEWGKLLKGCGFAEVVTGTAVPSSPEALAAGSTTTGTLGASASSTAQTYRGMPINFTGDQTSNSFITDYTGSKVATLADTLTALTTSSNYQIPVNVLYKPASSSIPSFSMACYEDGLLTKFNGCRGNVTFAIDSGGIGRLSFTFTGRYEGRTDTAVPTPTFDAYVSPPVFKGATMKYDRTSAAVQSLSLDFGNKLVLPDNPAATEGFDPGEITERELTGSINPKATLVASRDIFSDFRGNTRKIIHARWGGTAGNRIGITIPAAQPMDHSPEDRSGIMAESYKFFASGDEAGAFLCIY